MTLQQVPVYRHRAVPRRKSATARHGWRPRSNRRARTSASSSSPATASIPAITKATHEVRPGASSICPLKEKMTIERWADDVIRGYSPALKECLAESRGERGPGAISRKSLTIGPPFVPDEPYYHCAEAGQHFVEKSLAHASRRAQGDLGSPYWDAMEHLAFHAHAHPSPCALDLDEDYFETRIDKHVSQFRVLNYPDQPDPPLDNPVSCQRALGFRCLHDLRDRGQARRPSGHEP